MKTASARRGNGKVNGRIPNFLNVLFRYRHLIRDLVWRDFIHKYKGATFGFAWSLITPLVTIAIFTFVFSNILKVRFGRGTGEDFILYFMSGMLPWFAFSDGLNRSASIIRENPHFVQRIIFPLEVLPVCISFTGMIQLLIGFGIFLAVIGVFFSTIPWTIVFVPLLLALQLLFTVGLGWMLASLGVFLRDTSHAVSLITQMWMFLTPIMYPAELVPEKFQILVVINPMAIIIRGYRAVILEGVPPDFQALLGLAVGLAVVAMIGYMFFMKSKPAFADVL